MSMNKMLRLTCWSVIFQSKLSTIGESRMEMDYRLVENEGLFQEYLEMGKNHRHIIIYIPC